MIRNRTISCSVSFIIIIIWRYLAGWDSIRLNVSFDFCFYNFSSENKWKIKSGTWPYYCCHEINLGFAVGRMTVQLSLEVYYVHSFHVIERRSSARGERIFYMIWKVLEAKPKKTGKVFAI